MFIKNIFYIITFIEIYIILFKFKLNINDNFNKIPIAFSADNKYAYPLIVLLTSILYNSSPTTFYIFHIMISSNFYNKNKKKILGLSKKYPNCKIKFYNLGKKYIDWERDNNFYSQTVFYRLSLSNLIKNLDKIIYLDCDTMVHKDLTEFYNLNMGDNYYMGFPGHEIGYVVINGTRNFINTGVMLINLKALREVDAPLLFENYYRMYGTKKVDEYLINHIFYDKIKFLPFKYGIPDFEKGHDIIGSPLIFWHSVKCDKGYCNGTISELISSSKNRTITHGAYKVEKWWIREYDSLTKIGKQWIFYASKSNAFNEICNKYKQYRNICEKFKGK